MFGQLQKQKQMKQNNFEKFLMVVTLIAMICFFVLLAIFVSFCTPQKKISESKLNQEIKVSKDITSTDEKQQKKVADILTKMLTHEQLNIHIKSVKYDTEKPLDSITGKHPVSEKTGIKISKNTNISRIDSTHKQMDSASATQTKDNSTIAVKTKSEAKEVKQTGLNSLQRKLIAFGVLAMIAVVAFIVVKIKMKKA